MVDVLPPKRADRESCVVGPGGQGVTERFRRAVGRARPQQAEVVKAGNELLVLDVHCQKVLSFLVMGLVAVSERLCPLHRNRASRQLDAASRSARPPHRHRVRGYLFRLQQAASSSSTLAVCLRASTPMAVCAGVYKPRRARESALFRLVKAHLDEFLRVYAERFARTHAPLRPVVERVLRRFLICGLVEHGFARAYCESCRESFVVAFSCRGRSFCPSCEKKKQLLRSAWLRTELLAPAATSS